MLDKGIAYAKIALGNNNNKKAKKRKEKVLFIRFSENRLKCNIQIVTHRVNR